MLTGPLTFCFLMARTVLLIILVLWVPVFQFVKSISIVFDYPGITSILLVFRLIASIGKFMVHFEAGEVVVVVSGGGWFLIVVVKVEEGLIVVMVVVVEFRGGVILFHVIRLAGTAAVIIYVAVVIIVNFLIVAVIVIVVQDFGVRGRLVGVVLVEGVMGGVEIHMKLI